MLAIYSILKLSKLKLCVSSIFIQTEQVLLSGITDQEQRAIAIVLCYFITGFSGLLTYQTVYGMATILSNMHVSTWSINTLHSSLLKIVQSTS